MNNHAFPAREWGICGDCGKGIAPGDMIRFSTRDDIEHVECSGVPRDRWNESRAEWDWLKH